jgi:uncharacterized protein (DUF427 family)
MSTRVRGSLLSGLDGTRHEPTAKRIRATLGDDTVVDSTRAVVVWEPRRVVPNYAVPLADVRAELLPSSTDRSGIDSADGQAGVSMPDVSQRPVLDPSIVFGVHTAEGQSVDLRTEAGSRPGAGFRLADPDLADYVVLDFAAFDAWYEEDVLNLGHPRDPFHRIDALPSSRRVRIERDGELLAESSRPVLLFETLLPTRFYLPPEDVRVELVPSPTKSTCAYKGHAGYWSAQLSGGVEADLAWTYPEPLPEAAAVRGLVAFFDERVDVVLDGERHPRPVTAWSPRATS